MSGINNAVLPSSVLHRDTTVDAEPAMNKPRVGPMTPFALISPCQVLQALNHSRTTSKFNVSLNFGNGEVFSLACSWSSSTSMNFFTNSSWSRSMIIVPAPFSSRIW